MDEMLQSALALHQQGRLAEAKSLYEQILAREPRHFDALKLLGTVALQVGEYAAAVHLITRAVDVRGNDPATYNNRAVAYQGLRQYDAALRDCDAALQFDPANADALVNRGATLKAMGNLPDALASYDAAVRAAPGNAMAHSNRSVVLCELGRAAAALDDAEVAVRLQPGFAEAWLNRGNAQQALGRLADAVSSFTEATRLRPDYTDAWNNRGVVHQDMGRLDEALACFDRVLAVAPRHPDAHWNRGLVLLLSGRLAEGWPEYEWRRVLPATRSAHHAFATPPWLGETSAAGKTIVLYAEQGFGDTFQFCRYATLLARQGARVVLAGPDTLLELMRGVDGVAQVVGDGEPLPPHDLHCALMSLPLAFRTELGSIPAWPRYLHANPARAEAWSRRLGARTRPRVGLAWSGRPSHRRDRQRTLSLAQLLAALPPGCEYVSLQKDVRDEDRDALAGLRHFGGEIADFSDTAALCELVDVVVSVDTSVAHLAGALGRPTWVLLPQVPDWRWLLEREDSPWYPSARLFRQDASRDWAPVLERVAAALRQLA